MYVSETLKPIYFKMFGWMFSNTNFIFNDEMRIVKKKPYLTTFIIPILFLSKKIFIFWRRCNFSCCTDALYHLVVVFYLYNIIHGYVFTVTFSSSEGPRGEHTSDSRPWSLNSVLSSENIHLVNRRSWCGRSGVTLFLHIIYLRVNRCFYAMKNIIEFVICGAS